jgi:hypothetical protein
VELLYGEDRCPCECAIQGIRTLLCGGQVHPEGALVVQGMCTPLCGGQVPPGGDGAVWRVLSEPPPYRRRWSCMEGAV